MFIVDINVNYLVISCTLQFLDVGRFKVPLIVSIIFIKVLSLIKRQAFDNHFKPVQQSNGSLRDRKFCVHVMMKTLENSLKCLSDFFFFRGVYMIFSEKKNNIILYLLELP